ncbi:enoyl-CoA hydratase [Bradyrhizobium cenepequi]
MSGSLVLVDYPVHGCARLTLNRPESKNALSRALRKELTSTLARLEGKDEARVVILTGAGTAFCAGLDLKELGSASSSDVLGFDDPALNPVAALGKLRSPVIAAVNGPAITGGFELALACDVIVCSRAARFADTHARVGILPTWGLSQRLSRAIGPYRARELSLTGNFLSPERAEAFGLVNHVVEPEALQAEAIGLAEAMLTVVPSVLRDYKKLINDGLDLALPEALALEAEVATSSAKSVVMDDVERRRHEVLARAKQQATKSSI